MPEFIRPMRAAVVGAGFTGALLAARLGDAGHRVDLYDRRPDLRRHDVDAGRSINLAISHRGLDALSRVDLDGTPLDAVVRDLAITMPGRMLHRLDGDLVFQPYGTDPDHVLHSVNRDLLNATLLDTVDRRTAVTTHFAARVRDVDVRSGTLTVDAPHARHDVPSRQRCDTAASSTTSSSAPTAPTRPCAAGSNASGASTTPRRSWRTATRNSPSPRAPTAPTPSIPTRCTSGLAAAR
jgi:hypothetical protein